jgi:hypothetical protein
MLMIYSPAGTDGMFAAMYALTKEQIMDAELTRKIALEHDTVMVEQTQKWSGKRHDIGLIACRGHGRNRTGLNIGAWHLADKS